MFPSFTMFTYIKHATSGQIQKYTGNIPKTVIVYKQSGKLKRKASGGERAWFLGEESEPRNKGIFLAGENNRPDVSACLDVSLSRFWGCFLGILPWGTFPKCDIMGKE
jgi:hypothetical protein